MNYTVSPVKVTSTQQLTVFQRVYFPPKDGFLACHSTFVCVRECPLLLVYVELKKEVKKVKNHFSLAEFSNIIFFMFDVKSKLISDPQKLFRLCL